MCTEHVHAGTQTDRKGFICPSTYHGLRLENTEEKQMQNDLEGEIPGPEERGLFCL